MVQNPKGGGLSSSFGGGAQQMGGVQKTTDFLDRSTWILSNTFSVILILLSNFSLNTNQNAIDQESELLDTNTLEDHMKQKRFLRYFPKLLQRKNQLQLNKQLQVLKTMPAY